MDRVFSVDDMSDQFWSPAPRLAKSGGAPAMNRSDSEWSFQRFLQEQNKAKAKAKPSGEGNDVAPEIKDVAPRQNRSSNESSNVNGNDKNDIRSKTAAPEDIPVDSEAYQAFLKSKLNLACAAVALSRASYVIPPQEPVAKSEGSQTPKAAPKVSPKGATLEASKSLDKEAGSVISGIPSLPITQKTSISVRSTTSGSSRDQSEDDEAYGETATTDMNPADAKRVRRMLSNRESARRSRRRKQAHLTDLETQVGQLRVENSSLLKRLSDISQKYNEAAVDNRVLKADVETLRAKVKMAEETVKRLTGLNPLFHAMSEMFPVEVHPFDGSPSDASTDAAVPVRNDEKNYQSNPSNPLSSSNDPRFSNGATEVCLSVENQPQNGSAAVKLRRMKRVASLEHLQKRIRGDGSSGGS